MRISVLWKSFAAMAMAVVAFGVSGCSDDPVAAVDPGKSKITVFHANYDYSSNVNYKVGSDDVASDVAYGSFVQALARNGNTTISIKALGGTDLTSTTLQIDSTRSAWVIFAGEGVAADAFGVTGAKATAASAGNAKLRVIHASKNTPAFDVHIGARDGLVLAEDVNYKDAKPLAFATTPITTTELYIMKKGSTAVGDEILIVPVTLADMKVYSLVVYGSSNVAAGASVKLTSKLVEEVP